MSAALVPALGPALLLDTHIALWLDEGNDRLLSTTVHLIDQCWQSGGTIFLSAVSAWEIALLVDTGRIQLDLPVDGWLERFLSRTGVEPLPLSVGMASRAYQLHPFPHRDPADRMLIAAAIKTSCPLVTYDERIVQFGRNHGRRYGLVVV